MAREGEQRSTTRRLGELHARARDARREPPWERELGRRAGEEAGGRA
jgi:hypothetical protein